MIRITTGLFVTILGFVVILCGLVVPGLVMAGIGWVIGGGYRRA